ncbi:MAG: NAD(P)/FAD-dependent oxidoreductase [Pseudomonadota bacterium]
MNTFDAIILGAGGAGLMCAATAGQRGKKTLVLDHSEKPGKKILISGGGRCNFTNLDIRADRFLSQNPHFAKSALARYTQHDFIDLVNRHGISWHEKTLGQLFCDQSAKQIVNMLLDECAKGPVSVALGENISSVDKTDAGFLVKTDKANYAASSLVIATGGPSIPKMGATGFAYDLARQFKLKIVEPRPALVPLTLGKDEALFRELSGVATDTIAHFGKTSFREASLFTHKGLSGPAILQISSYWKPGDAIAIDFLPDMEKAWLAELKQVQPGLTLKSAIAQFLPASLTDALLERLGISNGKLGSIANNQLMEIGHQLNAWLFHPDGTEGFAKAEVTIGGISTTNLSSKTMEAKSVLGLYCIGEAVDVTGWLGGYNFQWAWSSGWVAGNAL